MKNLNTFLFVCIAQLLVAQSSMDKNMLTHDELDSLTRGDASVSLHKKLDKFLKYTNDIQESFIQNNIVNHLVPDFDARDTTGVTHQPVMYRGRVWIVYFWNFWDKSFQNEIPKLNDIVDSLRGEGVEIISFLSYGLGENEKKFLLEHPIKFPIIEYSFKFGNEFFKYPFSRPFVAIIDKKGICRYFYRGYTPQLFFKNGSFVEENKYSLFSLDFIDKVKILLQE